MAEYTEGNASDHVYLQMEVLNSEIRHLNDIGNQSENSKQIKSCCQEFKLLPFIVIPSLIAG